MTVEEITSDKQLVEPQGLPPIPEESLVFCKDCRRMRATQHFHQNDKVYKTCNMCRDRRKARRDAGKLSPSQVPEVKRKNDKIYNMTTRKPSPPKPRTEEQIERRRAKQREYNKRYRTRKKAEKEALAKL